MSLDVRKTNSETAINMQHFLSKNNVNICPITYIKFESVSDGGLIQVSGPRIKLDEYHIHTLNINVRLDSLYKGDDLFNFTLIKPN